MCNRRVNDASIEDFDYNLRVVTFFGKRDGNICKGLYYSLRLALLHTSLEAIVLKMHQSPVIYRVDVKEPQQFGLQTSWLVSSIFKTKL